jgi:hypothetical protein
MAMTLRQLRLKNSKPSEAASSPQAQSLDHSRDADANARLKDRRQYKHFVGVGLGRIDVGAGRHDVKISGQHDRRVEGVKLGSNAPKAVSFR